LNFSFYPNGKISFKSQVSSLKSKYRESWWDWLTNWGTADDEIKETQTVDENGEVSETETVNEAQTNQTTANGILRLPLPDAQANQQNLLIAKRGKRHRVSTGKYRLLLAGFGKLV
jgi:hypothetical protein